MAGMVGLEASGEKLSSKKLAVVGNGQNSSLDVEMFNRSSLVAPGDKPEDTVLGTLKKTVGGIRHIRMSDGGSLIQVRADEELERRREALFVLPKVGARKRPNEFNP